MIEIVPRSGPPEALSCPAFVCDACRKQVVGKGNITWMLKTIRGEGEVRQQSPVYVAHKGACDRALEVWLRKQYSDGWIHMWEELSVFLKQLAHNAVNDFADDKKGEYHQLVIKHPSIDPHQAVPDIP